MKLTWRKIALPIIAAPLAYLVISAVIYISKLDITYESIDHYDTLLKTELLLHKDNFKMKGGATYSTYTNQIKNEITDPADFGILIFRQKSGIEKLSNSTQILNKVSKQTGFAGYSGSLFSGLLFAVNEKDPIVSEVRVAIENYKDEYLIARNDSLYHFRFPLANSFGLSLNTKKKTNQVISERNNPKEGEVNEFVIYLKDEYIYFVYLKPFPAANELKVSLSHIFLPIKQE